MPKTTGIRVGFWHPPPTKKRILNKKSRLIFFFKAMNMSYYTDSTLLQTMMENPLEKKAPRVGEYGRKSKAKVEAIFP